MDKRLTGIGILRLEKCVSKIGGCSLPCWEGEKRGKDSPIFVQNILILLITKLWW